MPDARSKLRALYSRFRSLGAMLPGSLDCREGSCGKAGCRCMDESNPVKHGPYYRLCVGKKSLRGTFSVRAADANAVGRMCRTFAEAKELLSDIGVAMVELWRAEGVEGAEELARELAASGAAPSARRALVPAKLEASRDGWKAKAEARRGLLAKDRIRIRDLTASRDKWRSEALGLRKSLASAERRASALRKRAAGAQKKRDA